MSDESVIFKLYLNTQSLQGGFATTSHVIQIESFNIVLQRELFDLMVEVGTEAFIRDKLSKYPGVISVTAGKDIIVVQLDEPTCLESVTRQLIRYGFDMTRDGKFADFALVHGAHGPSMPCDWLGYQPHEGSGIVWFRSAPIETESLVDENYDWNSEGWITERGHGFMLAREPDHDVWLDFDSGRTIISLKNTIPYQRSGKKTVGA